MSNNQYRQFLSNPAISEYDGPVWVTGKTFSVQGTAIKSLVLLTLLSLSFLYTWKISTEGYSEAFSATNEIGKRPDSINIPTNVISLAVIGLVGGFLTALVVIFYKRSAPYLAPVYSLLEGLVLGAISAGFEAKYPGIVLQTVGSTLGITFTMLFLYSTGILRPTQKFLTGLLVAMMGILLLYLTDMIMGLFGTYVPVVHSSGPWGIALQVFIVGIASLNLIVDFGLITEAEEEKAPVWYEWYGAFSLMVTLVWLYMEILRLLAKLRND